MNSPRPAQRFLRLFVFGSVSLTLAVTATLLYLCFQQAMFLAYPDRRTVEITPAELNAPALAEADWRAVDFFTMDGLRLEGWFFPPDEAPGPVMILIHGHAASRLDFVAEANLLVENGYGALLFDLRNHGSSEGKVTSMGYYELEDALAAFAFVSEQPETDPLRIGLYGHSMGGAIAVRAMANLPEARVLVASAAYDDFLAVTQDGVRIRTGLPSFPFAQVIVWMTGRAAGADLFSVRPIEDMAQVGPRPVLILHGERDPIVPVSHGRRLYEIADEPKAAYIVEQAGHLSLFYVDEAAYTERILDFLDVYLRDMALPVMD